MFLKITGFITALIMLISGFFSSLTDAAEKLFGAEPPVTYFSTDDVKAKYGEEVRSIDEYANYGLKDVQAKPVADISFRHFV